ncbi:tRNA lysidine(34) synthetase TilS [Rhodopirellula sp. MGV]|uniref:tRNA lysidine(34) synthetase TilS n=1 Tax=Rhodopirellula sp. MGV TaxID=2023130 RepID=UPI000B95EDDF|nr:tRNA lysidine(34) synthetase TilS [Rhodopirellula sp. MGV]OYP29497.1 tRNA lysidine(34) synthetase TilS [Rhodopirellula sp. MGV]PNY33800.1 tRNA lysidine(34) synthetase TilS [Rhodopirellula baltica]
MSDRQNENSPWEHLLSDIEGLFPAGKYFNVGVVVGCSGGADSVALLRAVVDLARREIRKRFAVSKESELPMPGFVIAAHFNHALRGNESDQDESLVIALAEELGIKAVTARGDGTLADEKHTRDERYRFFGDVMRQYGARYLMLGHSLDDNVETVLFRLLRGTGPIGLAGIAPFRELSADERGRDFVVARPMLQSRRELIREALVSENHSWREDGSNRDLAYRRNWIRNELLPQIGGQFPGAIESIARAIDGQRQWSESIKRLSRQWVDVFVIAEEPLQIRRLDSVDHPESVPSILADSSVCVEALRHCWQRCGFPLGKIGQSHWRQCFELWHGRGDDRVHLPGGIEATRDASQILFRRISET